MDVQFVGLRMLASLGVIGAAVGAYSYRDAFGGDPVYPVAPEQARSTLAQTEIPQFIFGSADVHTIGNLHGDGSVVWTAVEGDDRPMFRLTAKVTPASSGDSSRIHLDIDAAEGAAHDRVAKGLAENPAVARLYKAAMAEQIDAAFNHRKFDFSHISSTMMATTIAMIPKLRGQMDADSVEMAKAEKAQAEDAMRHQTETSDPDSSRAGGKAPSFGEPQVDPDQSN